MSPDAVALDGLGRIYVTGGFAGAVSLGALLPSAPRASAFLAAFGTRGEPRWARVLTAGVGRDVVANGARVVMSLDNETADLVFRGTGYGIGSYVLAHGTDGSQQWIRRTNGTPFDRAVWFGTTPGRNEVVLYGVGSADALGSPRFPSGADRWHVALLRRSDGLPLRLTRFPNPPGGVDDPFHQRGVTLTPGGSAYCAGNADKQQADFGLGPIDPDRDVFLLKLSP